MLTTSHFLLIPCHSYQHIPCQPYPRHLARSTLLVQRMHWISKNDLLFICVNRQRKTSTFNHYEVPRRSPTNFVESMRWPSHLHGRLKLILRTRTHQSEEQEAGK